jgi:hypothetical protein
MRNCDGLTPKEFTFCEEYLLHGNMEKAYKIAFPNDSGRNGWSVAKRKQVVTYINRRIQEKQATLSRLKDKSRESLLKKINDENPFVSLEASKLVTKLEELEIKYKELEVAKEVPSQTLTIKLEDVRSNS